MRKHFAVLAAIALMGWLLAFATHIHMPGERAAGKPGHSHPCLFCSALQPGTGPVVVPPVVIPAQPEWRAPPEHTSSYSASLIAAYQSRAPPAA